jgi:hypothetical protein
MVVNMSRLDRALEETLNWEDREWRSIREEYRGIENALQLNINIR